MYTWKSHGIVYMPISWICIDGNVMNMHTCKSHENVYMEISWKCIHANIMEIYTCKSVVTKRPVKMENDLMVGEYKSN